MIRYLTGNILAAQADALVNTVNCVGVMGRGIALQFKRAFPANFAAYKAACDEEEVRPGRMFVFETGQLTPPRLIINFPTKRHWRGKSRIDDIDRGLEDLVLEIRRRGISSIAVPPLGCGLGGLRWDDVRTRIDAALAPLEDVDVLVYEPSGRSERQPVPANTPPPKMTPGRAALLGLMHRYLGALMDPTISLLEVHKLMYFLQEAGEPLRLRYVKGRYGPYAENLRHVLNAVEGHLIEGYEDGGDDPRKEFALLPGAADAARTFLESVPSSGARFARVTELAEGFETAFGLELLATVHWVHKESPGIDDDGVVAAVHSWEPRKRRFTPAQIALASRHLGDRGWLPAETTL